MINSRFMRFKFTYVMAHNRSIHVILDKFRMENYGRSTLYSLQLEPIYILPTGPPQLSSAIWEIQPIISLSNLYGKSEVIVSCLVII